MASGPTPQTHFEAWGEALIGITNPGNVIADIKKGLTALIMISDSQREWSAWYFYQSKSEMEMQVIGKYYPEILGEVAKHPTHFATTAPIKIDELCGTSGEGKPFRMAALMGTKHEVAENIIELMLYIQKRRAREGTDERDRYAADGPPNPASL